MPPRRGGGARLAELTPAHGGSPPTDAALTRTAADVRASSTAAAESRHFGFAVVIGVAVPLLWRRAALLGLLCPAAVLVVIVGTAHHWLLDCVAGVATVGLGAAAADALRGTRPRPAPGVTDGPALALAAGGVAAFIGAVHALAHGAAAEVGALGLALAAGGVALALRRLARGEQLEQPLGRPRGRLAVR